MQERRETRKSKARTSVTYLRCRFLVSFLDHSFSFLFRPLAACFLFFFFVRFCLVARSHRSEMIVDVVNCSACFFHCSAVKRVLRQTTIVCDRIKHSVDEYDDVFDENIRLSVYIEISESRGVSLTEF